MTNIVLSIILESMGKLHLGFSWIALVVFVLPMFINIAYVIWPPKDGEKAESAHSVADLIEQCTRYGYLVALCLLVSDQKLSYDLWFFLALIFLALYHVVWFRYFARGRNVADLAASFLGIPYPLVFFPVLYFLSAALWMNNLVAFLLMIVFLVSHFIVTVGSFRQKQ